MDNQKRIALIVLAAINAIMVGKYITYLGWYELALWLLLSIPAFLYLRSAIPINRRVRDAMLIYTLLLTFAYLLLWWGSGYVDGFGHSPYSRSLLGIVKNIGLFGGIIAMQEYTRAYIVRCESSSKHWLTIVTTVSFFVYALNLNRLPTAFLNLSNLFRYIGGTLLPTICMAAFLTWLSKTAGFLPPLIFRLVPEAAQWLLPVLPKSSWQTTMMLGAAYTVFAMVILQQLVPVGQHNKRIKRGYWKKRTNPVSWIGLLAAMALMFSFSLGLLPVRPMVIATGSMLPVIKPGDMVILQNTDARTLQEGDVIAYQKGKYQIVHRIMTVLPSNSGNSYIMKGDNNDDIDSNAVLESQIIGKVVQIIPYVGLLSLSVRKTDSPESVPVQTGTKNKELYQ